MEAIKVNFDFSEQDKSTIKDAVREVVQEAISEFGDKQRRNIIYKDTQEVCEVLKCTKPTLQRWRDRGYIEASLIGGKYLYSEDSIKKAQELGLKYRR